MALLDSQRAVAVVANTLTARLSPFTLQRLLAAKTVYAVRHRRHSTEVQRWMSRRHTSSVRRNWARASTTNQMAAACPRLSGDIRHLIPKLGLREYWYPLCGANRVKKSKPMRVACWGKTSASSGQGQGRDQRPRRHLSSPRRASDRGRLPFRRHGSLPVSRLGVRRRRATTSRPQRGPRSASSAASPAPRRAPTRRRCSRASSSSGWATAYRRRSKRTWARNSSPTTCTSSSTSASTGARTGKSPWRTRWTPTSSTCTATTCGALGGDGVRRGDSSGHRPHSRQRLPAGARLARPERGPPGARPGQKRAPPGDVYPEGLGTGRSTPTAALAWFFGPLFNLLKSRRPVANAALGGRPPPAGHVPAGRMGLPPGSQQPAS